MTRDEAAANLELPMEQAIGAIPGIAGKAEKFDHCENLTLSSCPLCEGHLEKPAKRHKR